MSYPADMATRTVFGQFIRINGDPDAGTLSFTPSTMITDASSVIVLRGPVSVDLNAEGYFEVELPCTDDRDLVPVGWTYTARIRLAGSQPREFDFRLPTGNGTDVDITVLHL